MAKLVPELPLAAPSALPSMAILLPSFHYVWPAKYPESALAATAAWTTQKLLQCVVVNNRRGRFWFEYRERNGCASTYSTNWLLAGRLSTCSSSLGGAQMIQAGSCQFWEILEVLPYISHLLHCRLPKSADMRHICTRPVVLSLHWLHCRGEVWNSPECSADDGWWAIYTPSGLSAAPLGYPWLSLAILDCKMENVKIVESPDYSRLKVLSNPRVQFVAWLVGGTMYTCVPNLDIFNINIVCGCSIAVECCYNSKYRTGQLDNVAQLW